VKKKPKAADQEKGPSIFTVSGAIESTAAWENIRKLRDGKTGCLQQSKETFSGMDGPFTDLELLTQVLNGYETKANEAMMEWRMRVTYDPHRDETKLGKEDPSVELLEIYELFRALRATGDRALVGFWLSEQSYPVQFLVLNVFAKIPTDPE
jgi:hypothetical protein